MNIQELAKSVNKLFEENTNSFWAVGLLCETKDVWLKDDNKKYLNESAQHILDLM